MKLVPIGRDGGVAVCAADPSTSVPGVVAQMVALYARRGFVPPWIGYLVEEGGAWVGSCGFTGPPVEGEVEIAYFTFPGFEGRGIATRMASELVAQAEPIAAPLGIAFIAHTLPEEGASPRILRRLGFALVGPIEHPEDGTIWKWRR